MGFKASSGRGTSGAVSSSWADLVGPVRADLAGRWTSSAKDAEPTPEEQWAFFKPAADVLDVHHPDHGALEADLVGGWYGDRTQIVDMVALIGDAERACWLIRQLQTFLRESNYGNWRFLAHLRDGRGGRIAIYPTALYGRERLASEADVVRKIENADRAERRLHARLRSASSRPSTAAPAERRLTKREQAAEARGRRQVEAALAIAVREGAGVYLVDSWRDEDTVVVSLLHSGGLSRQQVQQFEVEDMGRLGECYFVDAQYDCQLVKNKRKKVDPLVTTWHFPVRSFRKAVRLSRRNENYEILVPKLGRTP